MTTTVTPGTEPTAVAPTPIPTVVVGFNYSDPLRNELIDNRWKGVVDRYLMPCVKEYNAQRAVVRFPWTIARRAAKWGDYLDAHEGGYGHVLQKMFMECERLGVPCVAYLPRPVVNKHGVIDSDDISWLYMGWSVWWDEGSGLRLKDRQAAGFVDSLGAKSEGTEPWWTASDDYDHHRKCFCTWTEFQNRTLPDKRPDKGDLPEVIVLDQGYEPWTWPTQPGTAEHLTAFAKAVIATARPGAVRSPALWADQVVNAKFDLRQLGAK